MHILHHKSWHVYNKANIEKVRKDEAKAEEEAKKKHDRAVLAESEARLEILRQRANVNLPVESKPSSVVQHVNLFQDLEDKATNEEYEAEKKSKQDKQEKQFTMYLDKGTSQKDRPWYARSDKKDKYKDQYVFKSNRDNSKKRKRETIKVMEDPLEYITTSLKKKKHKKESERKHHRHHKEKEHKTSVEELRAKRLERERAEQARTRSLFLGHNPIEEDMDDRTRAYNSQFNRMETLEAKRKYKK